MHMHIMDVTTGRLVRPSHIKLAQSSSTVFSQTYSILEYICFSYILTAIFYVIAKYIL